MARQKEEVGRPFTVRIRSAQLAEIEAWMAREGEAGLSHQKAILRLVAAGIHDVKNSLEVHDVTKICDVVKERDTLKDELEVVRAENAELRRQLAERTDQAVMQATRLDERSPQAPADLSSAAIIDAEAVTSITHDVVLPTPGAVHATAPARGHDPQPDVPFDAPVAAQPDVAPGAERAPPLVYRPPLAKPDDFVITELEL
jgi:hypothetical protein